MLRKFITQVFNVKQYSFKKISYPVLVLVWVLGGIGMYLIRILQDEDENQFERQIIGYLIGMVIVLVVAMVDYHFIGKMWIILYIVSLALLLICKYSNSLPIYGWSHYDARRWIKIGGDPSLGPDNPGFEFQPSELTKIIMIVFLAKYFEIVQKKVKKFWVFVVASVLMGIPTFLIFIQTDFSTSVVLFSLFVVILFIAGVSYKILIPLLCVVVAAAAGLFWYAQQDYQEFFADYQQERILSMLYPDEYPDQVYQQTNAEAAIKSGGVIGKTLSGDTSFRGTNYVPVVESDFIFSAVAEEFGFFGSVVIILLFALLIFFIVRVAVRAKDYLGRMIAMGIGTLLMFQVFINIGVVSSLLPNTGIPLPFVSSGLSSLLSGFIMVGIVLNISMQPKTKVEETGLSFVSETE